MNTDESSIILFGFNGLFTTEVAEVYALLSKTTVGDREFIPSICKDPGAGKEKKNNQKYHHLHSVCDFVITSPSPPPPK